MSVHYYLFLFKFYRFCDGTWKSFSWISGTVIHFYLFEYWVIVPKFWSCRCARQFSHFDYIWVNLHCDSDSFAIYPFLRDIRKLYHYCWEQNITRRIIYKLHLINWLINSFIFNVNNRERFNINASLCEHHLSQISLIRPTCDLLSNSVNYSYYCEFVFAQTMSVIEPAVLSLIIRGSLAVMVCRCQYCALFTYVFMCGSATLEVDSADNFWG